MARSPTPPTARQGVPTRSAINFALAVYTHVCIDFSRIFRTASCLFWAFVQNVHDKCTPAFAS